MPVQFGELPPGIFRNDWRQEAAELRSRPNQWAKLKTAGNAKNARTMASNIRHGRYRAFEPDGTFEAVNRVADVWARYVGDGDAS